MMKDILASTRKFLNQQALILRRSIGKERNYQPPFDPFTYTKGRFLDRDREQRDARRLQFNFDALLDVAVKCSPGARRVTHCEKKEGGRNRVFVVHLDNESTVVARLPTRLAGPPGLTIRSEVATLKFVKERTTLPVPSVLAWSTKGEDSVGADYMIQEAMPGVPLGKVWNTMKAPQHIACIQSMGKLFHQLDQFSFPAYGSLYLAAGAPSGAVSLDETFSIGPICASQHWNCDIDSPTTAQQSTEFHGPWHSVEDYFADHIARSRSNFPQDSSKATALHSELLDILQQSVHHLLTIESVRKASQPVLLHPDFHARNIFVDAEDHTKVTGIIDWQSSAVEPAFVFAAETPDFASELPDQKESPEATAEDKAANAALRADVDFCVRAWALMQQLSVKFRPASYIETPVLNVLATPSFGWIDKDILLESVLNDLAEAWSVLELPGQSIYQPSQAADVVQRLEEYLAKRQMQEHLVGLLRCGTDGWVANDRWDAVLARYRLEYSRFVESVIKTEECVSEEDKVLAVAKANRLWPYDQR